MNKKIKILLITIGIIIFLTIAFFIGKKLYWNYKVAHATKIVELSTSKVPVYEENVKLSSLIDKINGKLDTNPIIKTNELGTQTIEFKYTTDEGYPVSYSVDIEVIDTIPPIISQSKTKTVYKDTEEEDLVMSIFCGDNYDDNPKCEIEGEYDLKTPGTYEVQFVATDSSGNKTSNNFNLIVKERPKDETKTEQETENYTDFNKIKEMHKGQDVHFGIDISHWQEDIDFQKVKDAGVEFAYIRVGRGNGIGKEYVEDRKFKRNLKGFNDVGIPIGVYFYSYANSKEDAKKEAKWLMERIKDYKVDLEIVFDWENWQDYQYYDLSFYKLTEMAKTFNKTVSDKGYTGMLYSSKNYLENIWFKVNFPVWVAHYTKEAERTNYEGEYVVWQLCDDGKVDGIKGLVDLDIRYGSLKRKK